MRRAAGLQKSWYAEILISPKCSSGDTYEVMPDLQLQQKIGELNKDEKMKVAVAVIVAITM